MRLLNKIPGIYRKPTPAKWLGVLLAIVSLFAGLLLIGTSSWFITATALTGMGLISLQGYNVFLPGAAIRFLAILRPLAKYVERLYSHRVTLGILSSSRVWVFDRLFRLRKEDLVTFRNAELLNSLVSDVDEMDHFYLGLVLPWFSAGFVFLLAGVFFWMVLPCLLWVEAAAFLVAGLYIPWRAYKTAQGYEQKGMVLHRDMHTALVTVLTGYIELRFFGLLGRYRADLEQQIRVREKSRRQSGIRLAGWALLQQIVLQCCLAASILVIHENVDRLYGPFMVLVILSLIALFETLQPLTAFGHQFARTVYSGQQLSRWFDNGGRQDERVPAGRLSLHPFPATHSIELKQLVFSYGSRIIRYPADLVFPANALTVITGSNGAGKSTLLDLLSGLRVPAKGQLTLGSVPMACLDPNEFMANVGYMEQRVIIFQTSIYENIAIAKQHASAAEVRQAAILAGLGTYLEHSPEFLNSFAGESGKHISGGQARMIALARIILKDSPILLLDEPTEGLDALAEEHMTELIRSWKGRKTIILVTHKKSIIALADYHLAL